MTQLRDFRRAVRRWQRRLGLENYRVLVRREDSDTGDGWWETTARVDVQPRYLTAQIFLKAKRLPNLEATACHEALHVLLAPYEIVFDAALERLPPESRAGFEAWLKQEQERVTTQIERALMSARWE